MSKLSTSAVVLCVLLIAGVLGVLHEDEAGKRDWYLAGVGRVNHAKIVSTPSLKQVVVASNEGVIAALSTLENGTVRWRYVLGEEQVCLVATPFITIGVSRRGVGHILSPAGALQNTFVVDLPEGGRVTDCSFISEDLVVQVVAVAGSSISYYAFNRDDHDALASAIRGKTVDVASAVTNAKIGGNNIWIERNGTGIDVYEIKAGLFTPTDTKGWLDAVSPSGDVLMSFYKDVPHTMDSGRQLRIMSAIDRLIKAADGKKGTACKECRVTLSVYEDNNVQSSGDIALTIREKNDVFVLYVAGKPFEVSYPGSLPPRVLAVRQTAKKADVLLRSSNNHLLFVTVSHADGDAVLLWERNEGITAPAVVRIMPSSFETVKGQPKDIFGFRADALLLSEYGTLYRIPVEDKGRRVVVVADVADTLRTALKVRHACHAKYLDLTVSDDGIASILVEFEHKTVVIRVEVATGIVLGSSSPVEQALFQSTSKIVDGAYHVTSLTPSPASPQYMYSIRKDQGVVEGLYVPPHKTDAISSWRIDFGTKIVAVATPADRLAITTVEHLRVFPNASKVNEVRRKFPTHNVVVVATINNEEERLTVTALDAVTGNILAVAQHSNVAGDVHVLLVEHVIIYHFLNVERMRYALGVIELFEHEDVVANDGTTVSPAQVISSYFVSHKTFSSLTTKPPVTAAMVLAFPGGALGAMSVTTSYQSINRKQVIFAMEDGHVHAVDLRALCFGGQVNPQKPEETYQHVMLHSQNVISHLNSVAMPKIVVTAPTELESSAHTLVAGLDLFYARVSSGKAFDTLNDDFNRQLLIAVCAAMGVLTFVSQYFSSRKALKFAWA